ncbi:MAG: hypothetical protein AAGI08_14745 [Bacteroidota bacterium]
MSASPLLSCTGISLSDTASSAERETAALIGLPVSDGPGLEIRLHHPEVNADGEWAYARLDGKGGGVLSASVAPLLYSFAGWLLDNPERLSADDLAQGVRIEPTFPFHRPLFDHTLTQVSRSVRDFDAEAYVERIAKAGYTHLEVNALSTHLPIEHGVPGEYYNQFYSYCAGLNQFVDSPLTRGVYPHEYLAANLRALKNRVALGRRYGLKPGIVCFEPRSLPEWFFQRYPTLRGARIDHPFRSFVPRYTLVQDHPVAREHYRTMMQNLLREVPDLAYMSIWTNDSGAGFEHTASLYVGRNGGPYLIREWHSHEVVAEAAGKSAVSWLRMIREAAAEINPDFEVSIRMESFKAEHDTIVKGMGDGVTIEGPSLLVRGYDLPYTHPNYPDQPSAAGTIMHTEMDDQEGEQLDRYRAQGFEPSVHYALGSAFNMEPLLGVPFPGLLYRKMQELRRVGVKKANGFGGLLHPEKTPYWPHPEVIRSVQLDPDRPLDDLLTSVAKRWAGEEHAGELADLWMQLDEAVAYFPIVPLYSHFGFVWIRTWVRPFIPNLEAVPQEERLYYERYLVSTRHNPLINDFGVDVRFILITEESGRRMTEQWDANVRPRLAAALEQCQRLADETGSDVFIDLAARIRAMQCWCGTQRNTCAWVAGVYAYLDAETDEERATHRAYIDAVVDDELANARHLLDLWNTTDVEFALITDQGETSYIYGDNLGELIERKIALTEQYRDVEPAIDREIMWRV